MIFREEKFFRISNPMPWSGVRIMNFEKHKSLRKIMTYDQIINSAPVVMVEFFATWCPHCHRMMPVVDEVRELTEGSAKICQLDFDQNGDEADRQGVQSVPTFIVYKNGMEQWRESGEIDGQILLSKLQAAM